MTLKEFREWLSEIPTEYDEFEVVKSEFGEMEIEGDEVSYRMDVGITRVGVDIDNQEIVIGSEMYKENGEEEI